MTELKLKYPSISELSSLIKAIKPSICDSYIQEGDSLASIKLTIGYSIDGSWDYQTGDNSYSGGAYFHSYWGIVDIYRRSNSRSLSKDLIEQLAELTWDSEPTND